MPWWAWAFFIAVPAWEIFRLSRAYKTDQTRFGAFVYDRTVDPFGFWTFIVADALAALFCGVVILLLVGKEFFGFLGG
jgi:hypothetical protein